MKILIPIAALLTGCITDQSNQIIEQSIPNTITRIPPNVAAADFYHGSSKVHPPAGRVIDYNGHGLGYNGYHVDDFHRKYYKDNGISPH